MGRGADAQSTFERANALAPEKTNVATRYGNFCFKQGRYE